MPEADSLAPLAPHDSLADFAESWDVFFGAVRRARGRAVARDVDELTLSQYYLLRPLLAGGELPVGELAAAAGVTQPTATRMLGSLHRAGLVGRHGSCVDRRVVSVSLTDTGCRALTAKHHRLEAQRRELFMSLSEHERVGGAAMLRTLAEVIEQL